MEVGGGGGRAGKGTEGGDGILGFPPQFLPKDSMVIFLHCISITFISPKDKKKKKVCRLKIFLNYGFRCSPRLFPDLNLNENNFGGSGPFKLVARTKECGS